MTLFSYCFNPMLIVNLSYVFLTAAYCILTYKMGLLKNEFTLKYVVNSLSLKVKNKSLC